MSRMNADFQFKHETFGGFGDEEDAAASGADEESQQPFVRSDRKVGRNEPCPCGSGKKIQTVPRAYSIAGLISRPDIPWIAAGWTKKRSVPINRLVGVVYVD